MSRAVAVALALVAGSLARADEPHVIKIATLAPEGTLWMNLFRDWGKNVEARTHGAVKARFQSGGAAGDERDIVRKMRLGQLGGAAVTSIGLGLIASDVRVLEVPMLIRSYEELDFVRTQLDGELRQRFDEKGFVLLGWGDVGPLHLFSNTPVRARGDLSQVKLWEWVDDPISRALFAKLGLRGVPLGVPDVLPALSTRMVDAVFGTPLAVLGMQWHGRLPYMTSAHFGQAIGATVMTKQEFDRLTAAQKAVVVDEARNLERKLQAEVRAENDRAVATMKEKGMKVIESPPSLMTEFAAVAVPAREVLDGALYRHELRVRVEKLVSDYRARLVRK
jgi:TRAP-type C4-dicarboxylate transport system substrate-binding protein